MLLVRLMYAGAIGSVVLAIRQRVARWTPTAVQADHGDDAPLGF